MLRNLKTPERIIRALIGLILLGLFGAIEVAAPLPDAGWADSPRHCDDRTLPGLPCARPRGARWWRAGRPLMGDLIVPATELASSRLSVTLGGLLNQLHSEWKAELHSALEAATHPFCPAQAMEVAARYLADPYRTRLDRELDALAEFADMLPPSRTTSVLRDAALLGLVVQDAIERGADPLALQRIIPTLLLGMEHWFAEVESAFGWMRQDTVPTAGLRVLVALLGKADMGIGKHTVTAVGHAT